MQVLAPSGALKALGHDDRITRLQCDILAGVLPANHVFIIEGNLLLFAIVLTENVDLF